MTYQFKKILLICSGGLTTGCFVEKLNETIQFIKSKCLFPGNWD